MTGELLLPIKVTLRLDRRKHYFVVESDDLQCIKKKLENIKEEQVSKTILEIKNHLMNKIRENQENYTTIGVTNFALQHSEMIGSALDDNLLAFMIVETFQLMSKEAIKENIELERVFSQCELYPIVLEEIIKNTLGIEVSEIGEILKKITNSNYIRKLKQPEFIMIDDDDPGTIENPIVVN